jgi:hypothetical protein
MTHKEYSYFIGTKKDDASIRKLLMENPMPGSIKLNFETNPSFFASLRIHGIKNTVIVARNKETEVLGFAVRSLQNLFINGKKKNIGYLSSLRVDKNHRRKGILSNGMKFLKLLDSSKDCDFYYTFIVDKNNAAKKIFSQKRPDFPNFYDLGIVHTYTIFLNKNVNNKKPLGMNGSFKKAQKSDYNDIISFVNKYGCESNFFPSLSKKDLENKEFTREYYILYLNSEIVAIASIWDQTKERQIIVKGYGMLMNLYVLLHRFYAKVCGIKSFPKMNEEVRNIYVSDILIKNDEFERFRDILDSLLYHIQEQKDKHYHCCVFSFHESSKLNDEAKKYANISYKSTMYMVSWQNMDKMYNLLKKRSINADVARA